MTYPSFPVRNTWAEINLDNLTHNIKEFRRHTKDNTELMAVVKADGYGHGAFEIAETALESGASWLGVALLEEGILLRYQGLKAPILILGYIPPGHIETCLSYDLTPTIFTKETAEACQKAAEIKGKKVNVHIKLDTGMGRVGVRPEDSANFAKYVNNMPNLEIEGIYTHFSVADEKDKSYTWQQYKTYKNIIREIENEGIKIPYKHACNSAAAIDIKEMHLDLVRIGISMYGSYTSSYVDRSVKIKPLMSLKTKVSYVKKVPPGTSISYGRKFITEKDSIIATIPVGYADGYSRLLSNKGEVLAHGKKLPVVGSVCMDQSMFLADDVPDVKIGDEVTLMGNEGDEMITADEIAEKIGTISYEVYCMVDKRVPRLYYRNGQLKKTNTLLNQV
ncbi:alanine racemase [Natranaerofaba carboxydovora]|uniref:alanine racemase n=1 Tax=Natranaerofaba carboxydovora TaxID=2742683 RepID=UPI001F13731B|nr:alanine racemase [Natranaerofaba carboxydovora]UMZ74882.1 Alanine racemase 1 [Natranaerofaba carboxydovora]